MKFWNLIDNFGPQNANAQAALQAANVVMGSDEQTTILRVIVDNSLYPVSLEVLYQVDIFNISFLRNALRSKTFANIYFIASEQVRWDI